MRTISVDKPFVVYKKCTLDEVPSLGQQAHSMLMAALNNPNIELELDHGRAFVRIELEVTIDPELVPTPKEKYEFKATPATGGE